METKWQPNMKIKLRKKDKKHENFNKLKGMHLEKQ